MGLFRSISASISGAFADTQAALAKAMNKELAEAFVAVQIGTANADGEFEAEEREKFRKSMQINPILAAQNQNVLLNKAVELQGILDMDTDMGLDACIKEIKEGVKRADEPTRITLGRMGVMQAKADGEIEPAERAFLNRVCREALGLQPSQIGL